MFPLGFFLFALGAYLADCAIHNRAPIATLAQILSDPGNMRDTLSKSNGTGYLSEFASTAVAVGEAVGQSLWEGDASDLANRALSIAKTAVGKPYRWGATGPNAFDCSGLMYWAYKHAGATIPRTTAGMVASRKLIRITDKKDLLPGDLVFPHPGHVFMYAGNNQVVEAPHTGTHVHITNMYAFWTARRVQAPTATRAGNDPTR